MTFRRVLFFLLLLTALRLAYIGRVELSPDEAYYQMWSERLDWGYYSKGPGVAAIIRVGTALFGVNEFGVRFFAPVCALGTSLLLYGFARRLYGESVAAWTVLLINLTPIFQAGALLMTIDAPSIFFWTAALFACWQALESGSGLVWWVLMGVSVGLGFLCKFTNAMELLCAALALAFVRDWRVEFRRPGFYVMLVLAAVVSLPPLIWNANHAWITFNHLRARGDLDNSDFTAPLSNFGEFWGAHFGVYSPLIFVGVLMAIYWGWRRARLRRPFSGKSAKAVASNAPATPPRVQPEQEKTRFLLAFGLPLLVMYALLAFKTAGEPNWTAPSIVALSVLAAALWHERAMGISAGPAPLAGGQSSRAAGAYCVTALVLGLGMSVTLLHTDGLRAAGIPWPYKNDPTARLLGWRSTAQAVAALRQEEEMTLGGPVFLIANRYQLAAELNFYLAERRAERPGDPPVYLPESQNIETQFSLWPGYDQYDAPAGDAASKTDEPADARHAPQPGTAEDEFKRAAANPFVGHSALFLTDEEKPRRLPSSVERGFEECRLVAQYDIQRRGQHLRYVRVYACFNYKGLEL